MLSEKATRPITWEDAMMVIDANTDDPEIACLFAIGFYTGCRLAEISRLRFVDVYKQERVTVVGKRGKKRNIKINPKLQTYIEAWYQELSKKMYFDPEMYLFASRTRVKDVRAERFKVVAPSTIYYFMRIGLTKAGVDVYKVGAHLMRKTFALRVFNELGGDERALITVSALLNHLNTRVTRRYLGLEELVFDHIYNIL